MSHWTHISKDEAYVIDRIIYKLGDMATADDIVDELNRQNVAIRPEFVRLHVEDTHAMGKLIRLDGTIADAYIRSKKFVGPYAEIDEALADKVKTLVREAGVEADNKYLMPRLLPKTHFYDRANDALMHYSIDVREGYGATEKYEKPVRQVIDSLFREGSLRIGGCENPVNNDSFFVNWHGSNKKHKIFFYVREDELILPQNVAKYRDAKTAAEIARRDELTKGWDKDMGDRG
ncbi:MAG: hypothetical protein WAZ18_02110 [Alphaproteobacteria bacterium]